MSTFMGPFQFGGGWEGGPSGTLRAFFERCGEGPVGANHFSSLRPSGFQSLTLRRWLKPPASEDTKPAPRVETVFIIDGEPRG